MSVSRIPVDVNEIVKFPIAFYNIIRLQRSALNLLLLICSAKVSHRLTQYPSKHTSLNNELLPAESARGIVGASPEDQTAYSLTVKGKFH